MLNNKNRIPILRNKRHALTSIRHTNTLPLSFRSNRKGWLVRVAASDFLRRGLTTIQDSNTQFQLISLTSWGNLDFLNCLRPFLNGSFSMNTSALWSENEWRNGLASKSFFASIVFLAGTHRSYPLVRERGLRGQSTKCPCNSSKIGSGPITAALVHLIPLS